MNSLDAIVVPVTDTQIKDIFEHIEIIDSFLPINKLTVQIDLIYLFNKKVEESSLYEKLITDKLEETINFKKIVNNLIFEYCNINDYDDIYIKDPNYKPVDIPTFGYKSGPYLMFEHFINNFKKYFYSLYMETDCYPVKDFWFEDLYNLCKNSEPFWIKGSIYKGNQLFNIKYKNHINGNAIYNTKDSEFCDFFNNILVPYYRNKIQKKPRLAYDLIVALYFGEADCLIGNLKWKYLQKYIHKFTYTNYIWNYGGTVDYLELNNLIKDNTETCLVHGSKLKK